MTEDEIDLEVEERVKRRFLPIFTTVRWILTGILLLLLTVHFFILLFIIPKFKEMFIEMDVGELPNPTLALLAISTAAKDYWYILIFFPLLIFGVFFVLKPRDESKRLVHSTVLFVVMIGVVLTGFAFEVIALFLPLIKIMDKLSASGK